ncbi:hypothetical protein [Actibacterium mucosum]|nr:hypothetical protein [Actibacterium mucosum]
MRGPLGTASPTATAAPAADVVKERKPSSMKALITVTGVVFALAVGLVAFVTTVPPEKLKSVLAPGDDTATAIAVGPSA